MFAYAIERELQDHIVANFSDFFDFRYVGQEVKVKDIRGLTVDLVGEDDKTVYLIELKRDIVDISTINQIRRYLKKYISSSGKDVIGIVAAPEIKESARLSINPDEHIQLVELKNVKYNKKEVKIKGISFTKEMLDKVDNYRRYEPGIPSRSNAIRELIRLGLEAHKNKDSVGRED